MSEEVDRNDPELKYLSVERNQFNDPATQAEWTQKRLVWVPHENQVSLPLFTLPCLPSLRTCRSASQPAGLPDPCRVFPPRPMADSVREPRPNPELPDIKQIDSSAVRDRKRLPTVDPL